ncbi:MAG: pilus assembly protein [Acetobacteraceae bacterium]|nr:pilus assembly protein [Acetobacteraceae bacterium]
MRRLLRDRSGATAIEFAIVAILFFFVMFGIVDLGRYAITVHSLGTLASATSRAVLIACYSPSVVQGQSPTDCTADPLTDAQKRSIAPFLFLGNSSPTVSLTSANNTLVVQASQSFTPLLPVWGSILNFPSRSATLPF